MTLDIRLTPAFYLQETLRDKTSGTPLANGVVTFYKDQARTELKTIYRISGTPPNYIYTPLPNPLTLSSIGTFVDNSGNDIALYYFPYDSDIDEPTGNIELYYITVESSGSIIQFTREGQPNIGETSVDTLDDDNFILNAQFRLFKDSDVTFDTADVFDIAYLWNFQKSNVSGTDGVTFETFPFTLDVEGNPTYFVKYKCTSAGTAETYKDFIYIIKDVNTFEEKALRFSFLAEEVSGSQVTIHFIQNFGTGGSTEVTETMASFVLTPSFTKYSSATYIPPSIDGKTIGDGNYIQIRMRMPLNSISEVSFTNAQLNLGTSILGFKELEYNRNVSGTMGALLPTPTKDDAYSQLKWDGDKFVLDSETGKIDAYLLGDLPIGYIALDGSSYVRTDKVLTTDVTFDRLYQKWETDSSTGNGNAFGYGSDGFFPMIYAATVNFTMTNSANTNNWVDSVVAPTGFSFNQIRESQVIDVTSSLIYKPYYSASGATKEIFLFEVKNVVDGIAGDATLGTFNPGNLNIKINVQGTATLPETTVFRLPQLDIFLRGTNLYFTIDSSTTSYYVWFKVRGEGTDPAVAGKTGILVDLETGELSRFEISNEIKIALEATGVFTVTFPITLQLVNSSSGVVTDATQGTTSSDVEIILQGSASQEEYTYIVIPNTLTGGEYWTFDTTTTSFYVWYLIDGVGTDPAPAGKTGIEVSILSTDTQFLVSLRTKQALDNLESVEIICLDASTLTGGEYFDAHNNSNSFYVWYNIDDGSTDPAPAGKTGIEVAITAADTAAQLAEKTRKTVSSYYFNIPDARGYFLKNWSNGSLNEIDSMLRLDRGDGTIGDAIGTYQESDAGSHEHQPSLGGSFVTGSGGSSALSSSGSTTGAIRTDNVGFADTRPKNLNIQYCIKY